MYIHRDCGLYFVPSKLTLHVRISELALDFKFKGNRASPNVRSVLEPPENVTPKPAFVLRLMGYNPTRPNNTVPCPALPTSAGRAFSAVESSRPRGKPPMSQAP
jgi:hypothetical protein